MSKKKAVKKGVRCEGYRRHGGAFSFGPARWVQCENKAIVNLTIQGTEGRVELPACEECWAEAKGNKGIKIIKAKPLALKKTKARRGMRRNV